MLSCQAMYLRSYIPYASESAIGLGLIDPKVETDGKQAQETMVGIC